MSVVVFVVVFVQFRAKVALAELQVGHKQKGAYLIGQLLQRYPGYPEMLLAAAAVSAESAFCRRCCRRCLCLLLIFVVGACCQSCFQSRVC